MYKPHRDGRFHYIHEAIHFVEEMQCKGCGFKETDDPDMPMCLEVSGKFIMEEPVEEIDDLGNDGIRCTKYRSKDLLEQEHPDQSKLF